MTTSIKSLRLPRPVAALVAAALALPLVLAVPAPAQAQASATTRAAAATPEYRLGAGDVLRINVYQNQDLTLETRVTESGLVTYPLLGSLRLGGRSVTEAEKLIAEGLRNGNFVKQPQVSIVILQVRGNQASVLGYVNRPGRYPIEVADMRLSDFLAIAGGVQPAGSDMVVVTGTRDGQPFRREVDLPTMFAPGGAQQDMLVQHGDIIWVERQPMIYIYGEVQRPGAMRLERGMSLMQALATGGGLNQRGTERGIRVHRTGADGKTQVLTPAMDDRLRDGDVVYVRESIF
ncbi:MAG: hypothetical protein RLY78_1935 [Pseudomonadota bacterium]|jgi:polysaccharide export outer membrane protein|uniref:Polysaccharide export protein EpsE n=1 Tax=Pseudaquabacterium rugosum TaxID=2984194 RepID=A0ABU9BDZ6_9BURK